ncbi:C-C motif chemokine 20b [Scomber japonicus]|uniref:C-C motif chemokine 20b n=1 Tax=Scomber japonicus TaxID=13676 RepID=UPI00230647F7|nr:C-C motif chemokine 20b [Scomber japonicus]
MTSNKVCLLAALCSLTILFTCISSTQSASCCMRYRRGRLPPCSRVLGYTIQTIKTTCDLNAIIFHVPGAFVCADPSRRLTQMRMKCVDDKRRVITKIINEQAPANTTSSA